MKEKKLTPLELKQLIDNGHFEELKGQIENEFVDAKEGMYKLNNDKNKLELAKDVSSFANGEGGIIIIGAKTEQKSEINIEYINEITPFQDNLINIKTYLDNVNGWIYPPIEDVKIEWKPSSNNNQEGLVYIFIPPQKDIHKPFLFRKHIDEVGEKTVHIVFNYAERKISNNIPTSIEDLHRKINLGKDNFGKQEISDRLSLIEKKLDEKLSNKQKGNNEVEKEPNKLTELTKVNNEQKENDMEFRIQNAIKSAQLENDRIYCLSIVPLQNTEIQSFLSGETNSIKKALENPYRLRTMGWGINKANIEPDLIRGEFRRVNRNDYEIIDLYRDGTFILICSMGQDFLGWSFKEGKINPLTFIEVTYSYFHFYKKVIEQFLPQIESIKINMQLNNLFINNTKTQFTTTQVNFNNNYSWHEIPQSIISNKIFEVSINNYNPSKIAYQVIREIYAWCGIEENHIPYTKNSEIDINKIENIQ